MVCSKCGKKNKETDLWCGECGKKLSISQTGHIYKDLTKQNTPTKDQMSNNDNLETSPEKIDCARCGSERNETDKFCGERGEAFPKDIQAGKQAGQAMSSLIEYIPFNLGTESKEHSGRLKYCIFKAMWFAIPFLIAIYPAIWVQGKIHGLEIYVINTIDEKYRAGEHIRLLANEVKQLQEDYEAYKWNRSFSLSLFSFLDGKAAAYEVAIENEEKALDKARKIAKEVDIPLWINLLRVMLDFLNTVFVVYIWFIFFKFFAYLVFRLAPSCGIPIYYTLNAHPERRPV